MDGMRGEREEEEARAFQWKRHVAASHAALARASGASGCTLAAAGHRRQLAGAVFFCVVFCSVSRYLFAWGRPCERGQH